MTRLSKNKGNKVNSATFGNGENTGFKNWKKHYIVKNESCTQIQQQQKTMINSKNAMAT